MEIGLKAPRQPLTDEQVEAIVYYLHLLTQDDNPIANPPRDPKLDAWVDKEAEMRQAYEDMKDDATNGEL